MDVSEETTRVYPRTHGGTAKRGPKLYAFRGLSPYTRGNRCRQATRKLPRGSIPVHTGEPIVGREEEKMAQVYPRTHGGTFVKPSHIVSQCGLSPYTRGNRDAQKDDRKGSRSIPVHTGEPQTENNRAIFLKVYPRTHGGTDYTKTWDDP